MTRLAWIIVAALALACSSEDDDSGSGGSAGSGGSSGGGGSAGNAGSAGHAGRAGSGGSAGSASLAEQYCDCMLLSCHDEYHDTFGPESNEAQALENCLEAAGQLPVAGQDVMTGNFVECRLHFCEAGKTDASACPNTVGGVCQ